MRDVPLGGTFYATDTLSSSPESHVAVRNGSRWRKKIGFSKPKSAPSNAPDGYKMSDLVTSTRIVAPQRVRVLAAATAAGDAR